MPFGTVCFYNDINGNGFIKQDENLGMIRVSYKNIINKQGYKILHEGQRVEFEVIKTKKGMKAINIVES